MTGAAAALLSMCCLPTIGLAPSPAAAEQSSAAHWKRAERNLVAILNGSRMLSDLSDTERRELLAYIRLAEDVNTKKAQTENCIAAEEKKLGRTASNLDKRIFAAKCREPW